MPSAKSPPRVVIVEGKPVGEPSATYLQIPGLDPELAAMLNGHVERARPFLMLAAQAVRAFRELSDAAALEVAELEKTKRAIAGKKPRRRR